MPRVVHSVSRRLEAMASGSKTIEVKPGSELAKLLDQVEEGPVVLEKDDHRYRLAREHEYEDIWAGWRCLARVSGERPAPGRALWVPRRSKPTSANDVARPIGLL